jgi:hypothetical protein
MKHIFELPFLRYGDSDLLYSAAVTKHSAESRLQAYNPAEDRIGPFPRNTCYTPVTLSNGIQVIKYTFVILNLLVSERSYYQMRIIHEDFEPSTWPTAKRISQAQVSNGFSIWTLARVRNQAAYAAGSLFVDVTNQKILGIDTRPAHYLHALGDQEQAVNKATLDFLGRLDYPTSDVLLNADILGYFQENPVIN